MTKRHAKTTKKKPAPKLPFSDKAKKGHVTVHMIVGVSNSGHVLAIHPSPADTMGDAFAELSENFDRGEHFDAHHFTTVLPVAKAPKPKKARTKKVPTAAVSTAEGAGAPDAGAA